MDIALKKIELIEWLARLKDEKLIERVEALKNSSAKEAYEARMPKTMGDLQEKLNRSCEDISAGRLHSQEEVENFFQAKFVG
jgi:hypothetical protein